MWGGVAKHLPFLVLLRGGGLFTKHLFLDVDILKIVPGNIPL